MEAKKVSIVLPVYNGEKYIGEAIESILRQTYSNIELIIVDDCSSDGTAGIIQEYSKKDSRIKIVTNITNQKLPNSLNIGFQNATGYYYTWTSDDNFYRDNAIEILVHELEANLEYGLVYSGYTVYNELDGSSSDVEAIECSNLSLFNCVGACFMYRRDIAEAVGEYDPDLFCAEDYDFWIRVWKVTKCKPISDNLYVYRIHGKSLTSTKKDMIAIQTRRTIEKHFDFLYGQRENFHQKMEFLEWYASYVTAEDKNETLKKCVVFNPFYLWYIIYKKLKKYILKIIRAFRGI